MNTNFDLDEQGTPQKSSESFMEPRTIPKNWDVSAFETPGNSSKGGSANPVGEPETTADTRSSEGDDLGATFDPFPQPRTIPGHWDVSDLM